MSLYGSTRVWMLELPSHSCCIKRTAPSPGIYRDDSKCIFKPSVQGYFCKQTDHAVVILESLDSSVDSQRLFPVVTMTGNFMDTFSDVTSHTRCYPAEHHSTFFSVLPSTKLTTICFPDLAPLAFSLYLLSGQNTTRLPMAIFYNEPLSLRVFIQGKYISPTPSSFSLDERAGANYFSFEDNLLYVLLYEKEPVEIVAGLSLLVAFTVTEAVGKGDEATIISQLAHLLEVGHDQVRVVHRVLGGESMLKVISANTNKKKYHCPNMAFCTAFQSRYGTQEVGRQPVSTRALQPPDAAGSSRLLIIELGDPPGHPTNEFTSDSLRILARTIINSHQTGDLQRGLGLPVDTLMVTQSALLSSAECNSRNGSRQHSETCLYVRPDKISVQVQPSDGEIEKQLPVQPKIIFLDRKGQRVDKLGPPSEPWVVSAHLKGSSEAVLKGLTQVQVIDGCAKFSNLAVSSTGTNWRLVFTVTSPPGATFTVMSQPFTIFPVPMAVKASTILVVILSSAASAFTIVLAFCWFKKSKTKNIPAEPGTWTHGWVTCSGGVNAHKCLVHQLVKGLEHKEWLRELVGLSMEKRRLKRNLLIVSKSLTGGRSHMRVVPSPVNLVLDTSRDGAATASLGNLGQDLTTLTGNNFFLTSNLNISIFSLKFFPLALSLPAYVKWWKNKKISSVSLTHRKGIDGKVHEGEVYNYCEEKTIPAFTGVEGTGAVGHAKGQLEEPNLPPREAKSVRKMSNVHLKTGDRHIFSSARKSYSHQQPRGGTAPGGSVEHQQPTAPGCSRQKEVPKPSVAYNRDREESERMPRHQNDVGEHVAMVAAEG
ncbi:hypothetical protein WISP_72202 [Willisornis vidua]|uniref:Uncharacterized protein n=1 Tax=Willisornis vidua TaxID=1566151 RepID=A0ABQ9D724_9PASS|nr:hypothetical protein WISP_72202 [Willisornis vidua]